PHEIRSAPIAREFEGSRGPAWKTGHGRGKGHVAVTDRSAPPRVACMWHGQHLPVHRLVSDPDDRNADHLGLDAALRAVEPLGDDRPRERTNGLQEDP